MAHISFYACASIFRKFFIFLLHFRYDNLNLFRECITLKYRDLYLKQKQKWFFTRINFLGVLIEFIKCLKSFDSYFNLERENWTSSRIFVIVFRFFDFYTHYIILFTYTKKITYNCTMVGKSYRHWCFGHSRSFMVNFWRISYCFLSSTSSPKKSQKSDWSEIIYEIECRWNLDWPLKRLKYVSYFSSWL